MTRRKKRAKKTFIFIFIVTLVFGVLLYFILFDKNSGVLVKSKYEIPKYGYTLDRNNTVLMKESFNELKDILTSDTVDYDKYALTLAKLFIIDLYTLDNKKNMYDIGSVEYVYDKENFKNRCQSTIYRFLKDESKRHSGQLPIVESIEIVDTKNDKFEYNEKSYDSYVISLSWSYKKDMGYDTKGIVQIINIEDKLYVVNYDAKESL